MAIEAHKSHGPLVYFEVMDNGGLQKVATPTQKHNCLIGYDVASMGLRGRMAVWFGRRFGGAVVYKSSDSHNYLITSASLHQYARQHPLTLSPHARARTIFRAITRNAAPLASPAALALVVRKAGGELDPPHHAVRDSTGHSHGPQELRRDLKVLNRPAVMKAPLPPFVSALGQLVYNYANTLFRFFGLPARPPQLHIPRQQQPLPLPAPPAPAAAPRPPSPEPTHLDAVEGDDDDASLDAEAGPELQPPAPLPPLAVADAAAATATTAGWRMPAPATVARGVVHGVCGTYTAAALLAAATGPVGVPAAAGALLLNYAGITAGTEVWIAAARGADAGARRLWNALW